MRKYQKLLILSCLVIAVVAVAWFWYRGVVVAQQGGSANTAGTNGAPEVALPQPTSSSATALVSPDPADTSGSGGDGGNTASTPAAPYYGEASTTASVFTRVATTAVPQFEYEAILVRDITTGVDIADVNEDARWPTASLTKLMTATLVLDNMNMNTEITITPQMMAVDPTEDHLVVGGTYSVYDLLHVMLMPSSNVAATAFAYYYGYDQWMALMNQRAQEWGMDDTHFDDPSGLSSANESTAHDLAILATHVYDNYPTILQFTDTPDITITNLANNTKVDVKSINEFAGDANFIGGKTGYIPEARDNLLSIFRYDGNPVLIIVLGASDTDTRFSDSTKLLDWFTMDYK